MSAQAETMDGRLEQAVSTGIAVLVTGAFGWLLGTFKKVDKRAVEEMIHHWEGQTNTRFAEVQKRLDYWEAQAGKFATREMIDGLKMEMKTDLGRVEKGIDDLRVLIIQEIRNK